jgi:murein DD-endopeptidase MepM/ murein hydrolase activator NlpD
VLLAITGLTALDLRLTASYRQIQIEQAHQLSKVAEFRPKLPIYVPVRGPSASDILRAKVRARQQRRQTLHRAAEAPSIAPRQAPARQAEAPRAIPAPSAPTTTAPASSTPAASEEQASFPPFVRAVQPVSRVPNWGAMHTPEEWNRSYGELTADDFVPIPSYDLQALQRPMEKLTHPFTDASIPVITAKLYYSTRFMGSYDIDAGEFSGGHPGVDLKLALGTPIGAIGGGKVHAVARSERLGLYVIIEHRIPGEGTFYSIYGHLGSARVEEGDTVTPGTTIGTVGMTGNTTGPHVHLQIDRGHGEAKHSPYFPSARPSASEVGQWMANPIRFIQAHSNAETVSR